MKFGILGFLLFSSYFCFAQSEKLPATKESLITVSDDSINANSAELEGLAIINDPAGYVSIYKGDTTSKIITRLFNDEVFMFLYAPSTSDWAEVGFEPELNSLDSIEKKYYSKFIRRGECIVNGDICLDKFIALSALPHINNISITDTMPEREILIQNDTVKLFAKEAPFDIKKHKINLGKDSMQKIDDKKPWGSFDIPNRQLASIKLEIKGKQIEIPDSSYNDLYEPNMETFKVCFDKKGNIYLYMDGSDACCSYYIAWIIKKGKYLKRYVEMSGYN